MLIGEFLWMLAFEGLEVFLDLRHVGIDVVAGEDGLSAFYQLALIVHGIKQDGKVGLAAYHQKTAFPVGIGRACAFGGDAKFE